MPKGQPTDPQIKAEVMNKIRHEVKGRMNALGIVVMDLQRNSFVEFG